MLEKRRIIQPKIIPMKPASFSGERTPADSCLLSSGRTAETLISGAAAINSRHGAFEPGTGLRFEFCSMAAFSLPIASSAGGTIEAVVRLPPEPGPSLQVESAV